MNFDDDNKITIIIWDYDKLDDAQQYNASALSFKNDSSQTVEGIVVYTETVEIGEYIGETRYGALIENNDLNKDVTVWSPDPNETAKMALSLKFN